MLDAAQYLVRFDTPSYQGEHASGILRCWENCCFQCRGNGAGYGCMYFGYYLRNEGNALVFSLSLDHRLYVYDQAIAKIPSRRMNDFVRNIIDIVMEQLYPAKGPYWVLLDCSFHHRL